MAELPNRKCPKCGSDDYEFRSRKKVAEDGKPEGWDTRYRCKVCKNVWTERT
jgi:DNA-directed RNA polymerase subunit M/transcription elongation factor TFIIS